MSAGERVGRARCTRPHDIVYIEFSKSSGQLSILPSPKRLYNELTIQQSQAAAIRQPGSQFIRRYYDRQ
jgi:hypothetical protein